MIVEVEFDQAETCRTEEGTCCDKHERRCEDRPLQPPRNEAEDEDDGSQHGEINHRRLQGCGTYPNQRSSTRTRFSFPLHHIPWGTSEVGRRLTERPYR